MPASDFNSLNDELVSELVTHLRYSNEWRALASTCRRLCHLVRTRFVRALKLWSPCQAPLLLRVPSSRAFHAIKRLRLEARICTLEDQAQLAKAMWLLADALPQLQEVQLAAEADVHTDHVREWLSLEGPLLALQSLPALRDLVIEEDPDERSLLYFLPALTQLTSLQFSSQPYKSEPPQINPHPGPDEGPPLRRLTNLVDLGLEGVDLQQGEAEALPPHLTSLRVHSPRGDVEAWYVEIAMCDELQDLVVGVQSNDPDGHPSLLLKRISENLTALTSLYICCEGEHGDDVYEVDPFWHLGPAARLQRLLPMIEGEPPEQPLAAAAAAPAAGGGLVEQVGQQQELPAPLPLTPLGKDQWVSEPAACTVIPPPNLKGLSSLVHLKVAAWWLVVSTDRHWRTLAGCTALQSLSGLHTCEPPPAGVTFPGVTRLVVTTGTSPSDTLGVLGAFPALRKLQLVLVPQAEDSSGGTSSNSAIMAGGTGMDGDHSCVQGNPEGAVVLPHLVTASIAVHRSPRQQQLAPYFAQLFSALPALQRLELGWFKGVELLSQLPPLSGLQSLACLKVGWEPPGWSYDDVGVLQVPALLQAMQTAPQLRQVEVNKCRATYEAGEARDQLVLGLQQALQALRVVKLHCTRPSGISWGTPFPVQLSDATLAALRPGLVVMNLW